MKICALTKSRITDYATGALTKGELREIEGHLASCEDCRSLFTEITNVVDQIERRGSKRQRPPTRRDQTHNTRMHPVLVLNSTRQLVLILFTVFVLGAVILFIVPWDDLIVPGDIKSYEELQKPGTVKPATPPVKPSPGVAVSAPLVGSERPSPTAAVVNVSPPAPEPIAEVQTPSPPMSTSPPPSFGSQSYTSSTTTMAAMPFAPGPYQLPGSVAAAPPAPATSFLTPTHAEPPVPAPVPVVRPPGLPTPNHTSPPQAAPTLQPQDTLAIEAPPSVPAPYAVPTAAPPVKAVSTPAPRLLPLATPPPSTMERTDGGKMKVDAHSLVNAYDYDYKSPETGAFRLFHDFAPSPFKPGKVLMRVGLQAAHAPGAARSRNRDLTVILPPASDTPGTARMQLVLPLLLDSLGPDDSVSVLQCGNRAYTAVSRVKATQKARIMSALQSSDSTPADWAGTLSEAMRLAEPRRGERIVVMIVNSDALDTPSGPNTWPVPIDGVAVHVVCVGRNPGRDVLATRVTRLYGGRRVDLATSSINWSGAFASLLEAASPAVARNVVIQNDFDRNIVSDVRPFRNASQVIANTDILPLFSSIHNGESVTMVYELTCSRMPVAGERVAELSVQYEDPTTGAPRTAKRTCTGLDGSATLNEADRSFQLAGLLAHSARLMPPESTLNEADVSTVFRKLKALPRSATLRDFVEAMELLNNRSNR
jgi:hypothetical protein